MEKVFAVTIMCVAHGTACRTPGTYGDPAHTMMQAESVELCKGKVKLLLAFDGFNPDDFIVRCE